MKEAYEFLKNCGTFYLATEENGQPHVRPFGEDKRNGFHKISLDKRAGLAKNISQMRILILLRMR